MQAAAESEMPTELQWRCAALEALQAFVLGPCARAIPLQAASLAATCASLLQPTLDAICAAPALQVSLSILSSQPCLLHCSCNVQALYDSMGMNSNGAHAPACSM